MVLGRLAANVVDGLIHALDLVGNLAADGGSSFSFGVGHLYFGIVHGLCTAFGNLLLGALS